MTRIGHFSLWGDFSLSEISAALGMQPSNVFRKGDLLEGAEFPMRSSTWDLHCPVDASPNEQVTFLLELLWPKLGVLKPLADQFTAEINVTGEAAQVLELKPEMLSKLASLGVGLNCFFSESEIEDGD